MIEVTADFETASCADLEDVGAWRYSEDITTEILCLSFEADGVMETWIPGADTGRLHSLAIHPDYIFIAHNAGFEKAIWRNIMMPLYGMPDIPNSRWDDTMAACAMKTLPLKLERAALVLRLPNQKDKEGSAFAKKLSHPNKRGYYDRSPASLQRVYKYCEQDVKAEKDLRDRLGPLPSGERNVWLLDQRINERGILLDMPFIGAAQQVVDKACGPLVEEFREITGGLKPTQVEKFKDWITKQGVYIDSLGKEIIAELIGDIESEDFENQNVGNLPQDVYRALFIRSLVGSASVKKLAKMRLCVCADGRARGTTQYHAASPGRWGGRLFQPHNFPRGTIKDNKGDKFSPETVVQAIMSGDPEVVEMIMGPAVESVVSGLRHAIIAGPKRVLLSGDFAGVECRLVLAASGQYDKVAIMASGQDVYIDMAQRIYKRPIDKKKDPEERQTGKNCFTAETRILTSSGIRAIIDVRDTDLLWDGKTWVKHEGLVYRGVRQVVSRMGIEATPEHPVLCGEQWCRWDSLVQGGKNRSRALVRGSKKLPSLGMPMGNAAAFMASLANALVGLGHTSCTRGTSGPVGQQDVRGVLKNKPGIGVKSSMGTPKLCQLKSTVYDFLTGFLRLCSGVRIQNHKAINTTASEAFAFGPRGRKTVKNFLNILLHLKDGKTQNLNLTEKTVTEDTNPVIFGLLRDLSTCLTNEALLLCNGASLNLKPVFDLANAGPRNRFTIMTDDGPVIVHNSVLGLGFQMGWKKFKMKYGKGMTDEFVQYLVKTYREDWAPCVPIMWGEMGDASLNTVKTGDAHEAYGVLYQIEDRWLTARLPSGRKLWYFNPQICKRAMPWDETDIRIAWNYQQMKAGQWKTIDAFGGLLVENVIQGLARDLMVDAMFKLEKNGFPIILTVHDEIVCEPLAVDADEKAFEQIMTDIPAWAKNMKVPIAVETWKGERYRK